MENKKSGADDIDFAAFLNHRNPTRKRPLPAGDTVLTNALKFHLFKRLVKNVVHSWKTDKEFYLKKTTFEDYASIGTNLQYGPVTGCSRIPFEEPMAVDNSYSHHCLEHPHVEGHVTMAKRSFIINILHINTVTLRRVCCVECFILLACVGWLREMGFIMPSMTCTCGKEMTCKIVADHADGVLWCCNRKGEKTNCYEKRSVRYGTWLQLTNMPVQNMVLFCYMWLNQYSEKQITSELNISSTGYAVWEQYFFRVCRLTLKNSSTADDQMASCSYSSPLIEWLEEYEGEGMLIRFLTDCAVVCNDDKMKSSKKRLNSKRL